MYNFLFEILVNEFNDYRNILICKIIIFIFIILNILLSNSFTKNIYNSFNMNDMKNYKEQNNEDKLKAENSGISSFYHNFQVINFTKKNILPNENLNISHSFKAIYHVKEKNEIVTFINKIYRSYIDELIIDDKKINSSNNYTFNEEGEHIIYIRLNNTFNCTDFMFSGISNLLSIYFTSHFNFEKIKSAKEMFKDCINLRDISFYDKKDKNIIDLSLMFANCISLKSLDITGFVSEKTKNISYMFMNCISLISIDLSSFDTINIKNMEGVFYGCSSLTSLDLIPFETISTINMKYLFFYIIIFLISLFIIKIICLLDAFLLNPLI